MKRFVLSLLWQLIPTALTCHPSSVVDSRVQILAPPTFGFSNFRKVLCLGFLDFE